MKHLGRHLYESLTLLAACSATYVVGNLIAQAFLTLITGPFGAELSLETFIIDVTGRVFFGLLLAIPFIIVISLVSPIVLRSNMPRATRFIFLVALMITTSYFTLKLPLWGWKPGVSRLVDFSTGHEFTETFRSFALPFVIASLGVFVKQSGWLRLGWLRLQQRAQRQTLQMP